MRGGAVAVGDGSGDRGCDDEREGEPTEGVPPSNEVLIDTGRGAGAIGGGREEAF